MSTACLFNGIPQNKWGQLPLKMGLDRGLMKSRWINNIGEMSPEKSRESRLAPRIGPKYSAKKIVTQSPITTHHPWLTTHHHSVTPREKRWTIRPAINGKWWPSWSLIAHPCCWWLQLLGRARRVDTPPENKKFFQRCSQANTSSLRHTLLEEAAPSWFSYVPSSIRQRQSLSDPSDLHYSSSHDLQR